MAQTLSDNSAMRSLCSISGFVNDIMFSHNGPMGQNQVRRYVFFRVRQVAAPGTIGRSMMLSCCEFSFMVCKITTANNEIRGHFALQSDAIC